MNWQLHKGKYVPPVVTIQYKDFKQLQRQATVGKKVEQLPEDIKKVVLRILQDWSI